MKNSIRNISLIFSENPIARAYLYLFFKENLISNKIIYLNQKSIFNNFFLKLIFNSNFKNTKKYLRSKNVLLFIKNVEKYFNLSENFLIEMYNFENILKADVIEIDIDTKDTKIFMYKNNKKVNIKTKK